MDVLCTVKPDSIGNIFIFLSCLLSKTVLPLLITLAVVAFIWGIIQYFLNPENEEKRKKGKEFIINGLIALFVIVCVWGLVNILINTFNPDLTPPRVPQLGI